MEGDTQSLQSLNRKRREAVELRLQQWSLESIQRKTGLSRPTVIAAYRAFLDGGWGNIPISSLGRPSGSTYIGDDSNHQLLKDLLDSQTSFAENLWDTSKFSGWLSNKYEKTISKKSSSRYAERLGLKPNLRFRSEERLKPRTWFKLWLSENNLIKKRSRIIISGCQCVWPLDEDRFFHHPGKMHQIWVTDLRGKYYWQITPDIPTAQDYLSLFKKSRGQFPGSVSLLFQGMPFREGCVVTQWLAINPELKLLPVKQGSQDIKPLKDYREEPGNMSNTERMPTTMPLTHLQRLEAESIQIMREVVAEADNPVMLYSIGKDSSVMLHLAKKAFYPSRPPFPLLHVDTTWKFREMYQFRDQAVQNSGMELITHTNPEGLEKNINPFTHGSAIHTDIMKTEALKQALSEHKFDVAFGGARRDEEKSRAKERIFSFRDHNHRWDPKNQRPELWKLYNPLKSKDESIRIFPLSNWTELDIWQYIYLEEIPIVPLYFAQQRPVVERDGMMIMVDDERMPLNSGEIPVLKQVRFRTLGCYPLTGAIESDAGDLPAIIQEMLLSKTSERQGRLIDQDSNASMEKKKQEGYF